MSQNTESSSVRVDAEVGYETRKSRQAYKPTLGSNAGRPIEWATLRRFESRLQGEIIHPAEKRYQFARRTWSGALDARSPGAIVRCAGPVDVIRSVDFARSNGLEIAVRAGGHSLAGDSFCDGGMVIDVSP